MDKLSIFGGHDISGEVSITSEENNSLDSVITALENTLRELRLTRLGHEEWSWGQAVEDSSDIDLEDISPDIEEELA